MNATQNLSASSMTLNKQFARVTNARQPGDYPFHGDLGDKLNVLPVTVSSDPKNLILNRGHKRFELKNHLGNVLATISDKREPIDLSGALSYFRPKTDNIAFYYPFGSLMTGLSDFDGDHRFGFNGMKKDDEVKGKW